MTSFSLLNGLTFSHGNQSVPLDLNLSFPSSEKAKSLTRDFYNVIYNLGWGHSPQILSFTNIQFGYSSEDSIKMFSKSVIRLPSSKLFSREAVDYILHQFGFPNGIDSITSVDEMLQRLDVRGANMDVSKPGIASIKAECNILRVPFNLKVAFPLMKVDLFTNGFLWASASLHDLKVYPLSDGSGLGSTVVIDFLFYDSKDAQSYIKNLIEEMYWGNTVTGTMGGSGIYFGVSDSDVIDTFSLIYGELSTLHVATPGKNLFSQLLGTLDLRDVLLSVRDENTFYSNVLAHLNCTLPNIFSTIPYLHMEGFIDDSHFGTLESDGIYFDNGNIVANSSVIFSSNKTVHQTVATLVSNIMFHYPQKITTTATVKNIRFGASKESAITFIQEANIHFDLRKLLEKLTAYVNIPGQTVEFVDIHTTITQTGVHCKITGTALPPALPFRAAPGGECCFILFFFC